VGAYSLKKSFEWELGDPLTLFFADLGKIANAGNKSISHFFHNQYYHIIYL
jgi:hypothetical protein